jgi:nicotinate phosphoribosyltransferase
MMAEGIPCVDFSARRTHGITASLHVAKASYIAGFGATSNVLAGKLFKIPVTGTMAHSFIEAFPSEEEAFKAFAETYPQRTILLIDTYNTLEAAKKVVRLKEEFLEKGIKIRGVRIDSGDLEELAKKVRKILDEGGLQEVGIFLSGGIDEHKIKSYVEKGVPVSGLGVGTLLGVSADEPFLDITYKLVEYNGKPKAKLSPGKKFYPGRKEVYRVLDRCLPVEDWICLAGTMPRSKKGEPHLLTHLLWKGKQRIYCESLEEVRKRAKEELKAFSSLLKPCKKGWKISYPVKISTTLKKLLKSIEEDFYRAS